MCVVYSFKSHVLFMCVDLVGHQVKILVLWGGLGVDCLHMAEGQFVEWEPQ